MTTYGEKAAAALDAAGLYSSAEGIKVDDWPKVSVLLMIANTQATVSMATSLERLADKLAPRPVERPAVPGPYL